MSTELYLLFRCLNSPYSEEENGKDEFNKRFNAYYQEVVGSDKSRQFLQFIYRRVNGKDSGVADEIVQEVMMKIYMKIVDRFTIAPELKTKLSSLNMNGRNNLTLTSNIKTWGKDLKSWIDKLMNFVSNFESTLEEDIEKKAMSYNEALPPLRLLGVDLLIEAFPDKLNSLEKFDKKYNENLEYPKGKINTFFRAIKKQKQAQEETAHDRELGSKGSVGFIESMNVILNQSPELRIPLPRIKYSMAKTEIHSYFDKESIKNEITNFKENIEDKKVQKMFVNTNHYIFKKNSGVSDNVVIEKSYKDTGSGSIILEGDPDDTDKFEFEKFGNSDLLDYVKPRLYVPIEQALNDLNVAINKQQKQRAERRLSKHKALYNQYLNIIRFQQLGYTVSEIAVHMRLSNDMVKDRVDKIFNLVTPILPE